MKKLSKKILTICLSMLVVIGANSTVLNVKAENPDEMPAAADLDKENKKPAPNEPTIEQPEEFENSNIENCDHEPGETKEIINNGKTIKRVYCKNCGEVIEETEFDMDVIIPPGDSENDKEDSKNNKEDKQELKETKTDNKESKSNEVKLSKNYAQANIVKAKEKQPIVKIVYILKTKNSNKNSKPKKNKEGNEKIYYLDLEKQKGINAIDYTQEQSNNLIDNLQQNIKDKTISIIIKAFQNTGNKIVGGFHNIVIKLVNGFKKVVNEIENFFKNLFNLFNLDIFKRI